MENQGKSFWEQLMSGHLTTAAIAAGGLELVKNLFKEHSAEIVKSGISWLGIEDEAFYASACSYAFMFLGVTSEQICRIERIVMENPKSRARFVSIIGRSMEEVKFRGGTSKGKAEPEGGTSKGKAEPEGGTSKGKVEPKGGDSFENVQGARALYLMSKMSREDLLLHLEASGVNNTLGSNVQQVMDKLKSKLSKLEIQENFQKAVIYISSQAADVKTSYVELLAKPTMFERIGKKLDIFGLLK